MDLIKKIKLWRGFSQIIDTRIGSSIIQAIGKPINWGASLTVSTNNDNIPWTPFRKPLAESCLAVVSTAGFYLEGDKLFDIDSAQGDASFRTIPSNFAKEQLKVAHAHYSHARVKKDINVLFPIDRLLELVKAKVIGKLSTNFYSFGYGGYLTREFVGRPKGSAHQLAQKLKADQVDYVIMIPA